MRKIKFRAWLEDEDIPTGYMVEPAMNMFINFFGEMCIGNFQDKIVKYKPEQYILMQYTGLHDRKGKEIYEGDIFVVRTLHDGDEYIWNQERFNFGGTGAIPQVVTWDIELLGFRFGLSTRIKYAPYDFEVIGNIYENKELLEAK